MIRINYKSDINGQIQYKTYFVHDFNFLDVEFTYSDIFFSYIFYFYVCIFLLHQV